jgi:hypothetical protein
MDSWCAPGGIFRDYPKDEFAAAGDWEGSSARRGDFAGAQ